MKSFEELIYNSKKYKKNIYKKLRCSTE